MWVCVCGFGRPRSNVLCPLNPAFSPSQLLNTSLAITSSLYCDKLTPSQRQTYNTLIQKCSRSSRPLRREPGIWSPSGAGEVSDVFFYRSEEGGVLCEELERWKRFRSFISEAATALEQFPRLQDNVRFHLDIISEEM